MKNAGHAFPIKGHERKEVSSEEGRMPFGARPAPKGLTQILNSKLFTLSLASLLLRFKFASNPKPRMPPLGKIVLQAIEYHLGEVVEVATWYSLKSYQ